MKQIASLFKRSPFALAFAGVGIVCFALYCVTCIVSGASILPMLSFLLCIPLYLIFPGLFWAKLIGPRHFGLTPLLSILYGCGFFAILVCVSVRLQMLWALRLIPPILCGIYLFSFFHSRRLPFELRPSQPKLVCIFTGIFGILCLLYSLFLGSVNPHPMAAGSVFLNRHLLWNIGNGNSLMQTFPLQDIRFAGVELAFPYLTEVLTAGLCLVSGSSSYDAFTFFAGPGFLAAELVALYGLGRCFYADSRKKSVAFLLLLFAFQGLSLRNEAARPSALLWQLVTNIDAQATALIFLCIFTALFTTMARLQFRVNWRFFVVYFFSFFLLAVTTWQHSALLLCGLVVTMALVFLFQNLCTWKALFCLAGTVGIFLLVFGFFTWSGAAFRISIASFSQSSVFSIPQFLLVGLVAAFAMVPLQFLLWLRGLPYALGHFPQLDAGHILASCVMIGGCFCCQFFVQSNSAGPSFAFAAIIFVNLLAVEQLFRLQKPRTLFFYPAVMCAAIGLCSTIFLLFSYGNDSIAQLKQTLNPNYSAPVNGQVSAGAEQAMLWLRSKTDPSTVFATNRTSSTPTASDGISNVFSAFSGRQSYMEGWTYTVSTMDISQDIVAHRQQVLDQIFSGELSKQQLTELCQQEGINCIVYAKHYAGKAPNLTIAYENDSVCIYFL